MSYVKQFTVGGCSYNAVMASADGQQRLMSLLSDKVTGCALKLAVEGKKLDKVALVTMFNKIPYSDKMQVSEILMNNVKVNGTDVSIDLEHFRGKTMHYATLCVDLLMWNLGDFLDWLHEAIADVVQLAYQAQQAQAPVL